MAIPNRQIGWSNESNLLWFISKELERLTGVTSSSLASIIAALSTKITNEQGVPAFYSDTLANIPPAGETGRMFIATDTFAFYRDNGVGWDLIGGPGIGTVTGSGAATQVAFWNGTSVVSGSSNLYWDNVNNRLGIGGTPGAFTLDVNGTARVQGATTITGSTTASGAIARGINATPTLVASANNDVLVGLDVNPTFTNGAFTGVSNLAARFQNADISINGFNFGKGNGSGTNNIAIGTRFGTLNTSNNNTGVGAAALLVDIGGNNTACGYAALLRNTTGTQNVGMGSVALQFSTTGSNNTALGYNAGAINTTGSNNIFIGNWTTGIVGTNSNWTFIGNPTTTSTFIAGNLLLNTQTDAGFRLDVNGTARVQGQLTVSTGGAAITGAISATSNGHRFGNIQVLTSGSPTNTGVGMTCVAAERDLEFYGGGASAGTNMFSFNSWNGQNIAITNVNRSTVRILSGFTDGNINNLSGNHLWLSPTYNFAGTRTGIVVRGIYYNPTLTSLTNTTHRAIETETGDVLLGTTSGNVAIGTSTTPTAKLQVTGSITAASAIARGVLMDNTLVAAANNDFLIGLDVQGTFTNGAFTGVTQFFARFANTAGGTSLPATSGTAQTGGILRLGRDNAVLDIGSNSSSGAWLQSVNRTNLASNFPIYLNPNGGNILIGTTTDAGFRLDITGTVRFGVNLTSNDILGNLNFRNGSNAAYIMQENSTARSIQIPGTGGNAHWIFNNSGAGWGLQGSFANGTFLTRGDLITFTNANFAGNSLQVIGINGTQAGDNRNIYIGNNGAQYANEKGTNIRLVAGIGGTSGGDRVGGDIFLTPGLGGGVARSGYVVLAHTGTATQGNVGVGTATPVASALVDITSTTQGFLPPRMTTAQKNGIVGPANGLVVYDTTLAKLCVFTGVNWETVTSV